MLFCKHSYYSEILLNRWTLKQEREVLLPGKSTTVDYATMNNKALLCFIYIFTKLYIYEGICGVRSNFGVVYIYRLTVLHGSFVLFDLAT